MITWVAALLGFFTQTSSFVDWSGLFKALLNAFGVTLLLAVMVCPIGCSSCQQTSTERLTGKMITEVLKPAAEKAVEQLGSDTATVTGTGALINPGYEGEFEGYWVVGVRGKMIVKATGISATLAGSTQASTTRPAK